MDDVELTFEPEAIEAIADKAFERKTGARGLRAILEDLMMDIMYDVPSQQDAVKCIVHKDCVTENKRPELIKGAKPKKQRTSSRSEKTEEKGA